MGQLAHVDELIAMLDLGGDNPARVNQPLVDQALQSAERTVKQLTGREFYPTPALDNDGLDTGAPVTRTFRVRRNRRGAYGTSNARACIPVRIADLREATDVSLDGVPLVEGQDFDFNSFEGDEPFTTVFLYQSIAYSSVFLNQSAVLEITGRWGFLEVPYDVKEAALQIAARRYHRRNAMFADQVDTGTGAFDFRGGVHPDVQSTLRRYRPVQATLV